MPKRSSHPRRPADALGRGAAVIAGGGVVGAGAARLLGRGRCLAWRAARAARARRPSRQASASARYRRMRSAAIALVASGYSTVAPLGCILVRSHCFEDRLLR
jgi:hypothetical protein